ncbi:hypothetical protein [Anoxybacter fermentans]|nr:hypothetical protein [Anoxybacter fermentans]
MKAEEITNINDPDSLVQGIENVTPRCLALQAALYPTQNLLDRRLA